MRLVLLRHGRTQANERRLYCGISDEPLCERGRRGLLALKEAGIYPDFSELTKITSGMRRTNETLRILTGSEPDAHMPAFREMNFGRFEMHSYDELKSDPDYQAWIMDECSTVQTPGGESAVQFHERIFAAADNLKKDTLLVCHGGVIAALMQRWFPHEGRNMYQWQPDSGCGYEIIDTAEGKRYLSIMPEIKEL